MADPLYRQIAEDLRQKIESGEIPRGSQLPTELELRELYNNASRNTVRDAIKSLTTQGLVITYPGRGTFVAKEIRPFIAPLNPGKTTVSPDEDDAFIDAIKQQGGEPQISKPTVEIRQPGDVAADLEVDVASELGIGKDSTVVIRHQRRYVDGKPSSLQTTFYPMAFIDRGAVALLQPFDIKPGATKYLEETLGLDQAGYRDRLTVRRPSPGEIQFFKFADTASALVVVVHRTVYDNDGTPIRFTVTVYPSDRNHFVIEFGKVPPLPELLEVV